MAGEAEISFDDAAGVVPVQQENTPAQPEAGEISFADAMGSAPVSGPSLTSRLGTAIGESYERLQQGRAIHEQARGMLFDKAFDTAINPDDSFASKAGKTALAGIRALVTSPTKTAIGGVKALGSGIVGLGESAVAGIRGVGRAAGEAIVKETVGRLPIGQATAPIQSIISGAQGRQPLAAAVSEIESSMEQTAKMREIASQITKINLAPENEQEKAAEGLLMLLPEGIAAAGDTVYEKTGSALAGAGTQGILTLLTFDLGLVGRMVGGKATPKVIESVGKLAKEDLPAAEQVTAHIEQAAPKVAAKLKIRLKPIKERPAAAGERAVKAEVKGKEITPEEAGIKLSETVQELPQVPPSKPNQVRPQLTVDEFTGQFEVKTHTTEFLAQENGKYLQIKRSDTKPEARGKGHAQEIVRLLLDEAELRGLVLSSDFSVSKDAQRVYDALRRKGFEVKENPHTVNPETGSKVSTDPRVPVYEVTKKTVEQPQPQPQPVKGKQPEATATETTTAAITKPAEPAIAPTEAAKAEQIFVSGPTLSSLPGGQFIAGKLAAWYQEALRTVHPEGLGPEAKISAAVTANRIAESMNRDAANHGLAVERLQFWERIKPQDVLQFMKLFESGWRFKDPALQRAAANLRQRAREVFNQDRSNGIEYDPIDNYLYHVFEASDEVAGYFERRYGKQWGNPSFTRDRMFQLYEEAINAGFTPKFKNPEEIMLAREHASDIAQMRVQILNDLESWGLAQRAQSASRPPQGGDFIYRRSPNGQGYWVDATAEVVLHNAFETRSLWNIGGFRGDVFKGAMFLKNAIVPIKLALSLFHPLHVATIDNATGMVRASKELLSGAATPAKWLKGMLESAVYKDLAKETAASLPWVDMTGSGNRILRAYQGKIDPQTLGPIDLTALQYMAEGGMIPEMSVQYRIGAADKFRQAINEVRAQYPGKGGIGRSAKPVAKAAWNLPFAVIELLQRPMFQVWIPSLKIASYLKDVQTAFKADPMLLQDRGRRVLALRKLAKSIDNRYGEMAYNTLFWNRTVKDLAVANTLSLGWNLGFIREYGGAVIDIGQSVTRQGSLSRKAKQGMLDRPLFVSFYTIQSLLYGGLLTWALTGKAPEDLIDYIYPKNGNKTPSGEDERMTTMFYAREFAAISKHIEQEGVIPGLTHLAANKASGIIGTVNQWRTGTNWMDQEIRDPNSPWHQKVTDTLKATLLDLEPISVKSARESELTGKDIALSVAGFSKAPRYVTQTNTEASISTLYRKYYAPKQTPYETALISDDRRQLAKLYAAGKVEEYGELLDEMMTKYDLTATEQGRLARNIMKRGVDYNPYLTMFERLTWQQQKRLLDEMTEDERTEYLPHANKEHLRYSYEEP